MAMNVGFDTSLVHAEVKRTSVFIYTVVSLEFNFRTVKKAASADG